MWQFIDVHGFIITGIYFVIMLFESSSSGALARTSPPVSCKHGTRYWLHYVMFHLLVQPMGFMATTHCNRSLYFTVVLVLRSLGDSYWDCHVARSCELLSWYRTNLRWQAIGQIDSFPTMFSFLAFLVVHVTLIVMTGFARNMNHIVLGIDDQGHLGMDPGFRWYRRGRRLVDRGALHLVEPTAWIAARAQVRDLSDAASDAESPEPAAEVFRGGNLAVLLAERENAGPGRLEGPGGKLASSTSGSRWEALSKGLLSFPSPTLNGWVRPNTSPCIIAFRDGAVSRSGAAFQ